MATSCQSDYGPVPSPSVKDLRGLYRFINPGILAFLRLGLGL